MRVFQVTRAAVLPISCPSFQAAPQALRVLAPSESDRRRTTDRDYPQGCGAWSRYARTAHLARGGEPGRPVEIRYLPLVVVRHCWRTKSSADHTVDSMVRSSLQEWQPDSAVRLAATVAELPSSGVVVPMRRVLRGSDS